MSVRFHHNAGGNRRFTSNMSWVLYSYVMGFYLICHESCISSVMVVSLSCQGAMYHFLGDFYLICRGIQISLVMWFISHLSWKSYIICGGDFISPVIGFISHLTWRVISYLWLEWYLTCHWDNFSSVIGVVSHMSWGLSWGLHLICYECYVSNLSWRYISSFVEFWGERAWRLWYVGYKAECCVTDSFVLGRIEVFLVILNRYLLKTP